MDWIIDTVTDKELYKVVQLKCPKCGLKKTVTRYLPDVVMTCEVCETSLRTPEEKHGT